MPSVVETPVSVAAVMVGFDGGSGASVSIVTVRAVDAFEVLPAGSVARAVMLCAPSLRLEVVIDHDPAVTVALPTAVVPLKSVTVARVLQAVEDLTECFKYDDHSVTPVVRRWYRSLTSR